MFKSCQIILKQTQFSQSKALPQMSRKRMQVWCEKQFLLWNIAAMCQVLTSKNHNNQLTDPCK